MLGKIFCVIGLLLSTAAVHAANEMDLMAMVTGQKFLTVANDRNAYMTEFYVTVTHGAVGSFDYVAQGSDKKFTLAQLTSASGVVLEEQQGVKALILLGKISNTNGQGQLTFRYISNGLTGKYADCTVNFMRASDGTWVLLDSAGKVIQNAKIISWNLGISTIQGICPASLEE